MLLTSASAAAAFGSPIFRINATVTESSVSKPFQIRCKQDSEPEKGAVLPTDIPFSSSVELIFPQVVTYCL
jgi:hypothetical protein